MYWFYKWIQHSCSMGMPKLSPGYEPVGIYRVLARPYFMTFYVIFPIHLNFPIRSSYVFKGIIQRKKVDCFMFTWESFFFFKKTLYCTCMCYLLFFMLFIMYLLFLPYHVLYTVSFFSVFVRDFLFASFPLIF